MGMCSGKDYCPKHTGQTLTEICLYEQCLEPLCNKCAHNHHIIHEKLGYPAKIESYQKVKKQYKVKRKPYIKKFTQITQNITPPSLLVKQYTKQYFDRNRESSKGKQSSRIMSELELWKQLSEDPRIRRKINAFLRDNTQPNSAIVGQRYTHLY